MKLFCTSHIPILILLLCLPSVAMAQVQTGHYAPGWNGVLKAGVMISDPGFYMMNTNMFFNANKFVD